MIPTPTLAELIILTSLAPSPIARVVFKGCFSHIIRTTSAFYFGETQQAITTFIFSEISMNF